MVLTTQANDVLDVWWNLVAIFSGGVLGLFLLGFLSRRVTSRMAALAVVFGELVIVWATFSPTKYWPESLDLLRNPLNSLLTLVLGTLVILVVGLAGSLLWARGTSGPNKLDLAERQVECRRPKRGHKIDDRPNGGNYLWRTVPVRGCDRPRNFAARGGVFSLRFGQIGIN